MKRARALLDKEIYLFLLPLFFVLHGFVANYPAVPLKDAAIVFIRYGVIISVAVIIFFILFKRFQKAAWFVFFLFLFQFFFGPFHDLLKSAADTTFFSKHVFLFFFFLLIFIYFFIRLRRYGVDRKFIRFANLLLLLWIVIDMATLGFSKDNKPKKNPSSQTRTVICPACPRPDVYFIVADEYAGFTALKNVFAFDNTAFEDSLRLRGFQITTNTTSNYNYTPYSIASILNMDYIKGISDRSNDINNRTTAYKHINEATATNFFRGMGYQFYNFSPFDFAGEPTTVNTQFFLTREKLITGQTYTNRIQRDLSFNLVTRFKFKPLLQYWSKHTWNINQQFYNGTITAAEKEGIPKLVYTHLFMPHYPYYFNEHGQPFPLESLMEGEQGNQKHYIAYLKFSNKRFLALIDDILQKSTQPPVIIFMGDHGFRHLSSAVDRKYHFSNFNAVLLPSKNYKGFYSGMSAVNQFRAVLNGQFGQQLTMLKDSSSFLREY